MPWFFPLWDDYTTPQQATDYGAEVDIYMRDNPPSLDINPLFTEKT